MLVTYWEKFFPLSCDGCLELDDQMFALEYGWERLFAQELRFHPTLIRRDSSLTWKISSQSIDLAERLKWIVIESICWLCYLLGYGLPFSPRYTRHNVSLRSAMPPGVMIRKFNHNPKVYITYPIEPYYVARERSGESHFLEAYS